MFAELNERARTILQMVVESYLETGEPVGSRTLSKMERLNLSPASIRNVMQDLEEQGFLEAPHVSAGRQPTQTGLRFYVDGLMSVGNLRALSAEERARIEAECAAAGRNISDVFTQAGTTLSGLSSCASLVLAPKSEKPLRHLSFVALSYGRVLAVLVSEDGLVENRIMEAPMGVSAAALESAGNYLTEKLRGKTLPEARSEVMYELSAHQSQLDKVAEELVRKGIELEITGQNHGHLVIKGASRLLEDVRAMEDLENARRLLEDLENEETMLKILDSAQGAEGVQVFIGSENVFFANSACSVVLSPLISREDGPGKKQEKVIGAVGVIGPTRLNYGRIVPMVDYTSRVVSNVL